MPNDFQLPITTPEPEPENTCVECCDCGGDVEVSDAYTVDGDYFCNDCVIVCERCEEVVRNSDATRAGDCYYCSDNCASEAGWIYCDDCEEWRDSDCSTYIEGHGTVCERCRDSGCYRYCEECGNDYEEDDGEYSEAEEEWRCYGCLGLENPRRSRRSRSGEYVPRLINEYGYKPEAVLQKMDWENTTYLGLELEVECGDKSRNEMAQKLKDWLTAEKLSDYIYFKDDGSLSNGIELVFHPFTLKAFHKKFPLRKLLLKLKDMGFLAYKTGSCGLHIHVSKSSFQKTVGEKSKGSGSHVGKVFFYLCQSYLKKFSRRKKNGFGYCQFDTSFPVDGIAQMNGRYSALNTCASDKTYEIRIFRATLDYKRFLASLQFADAFTAYVAKRSLAFMKNHNGAEVWQDFLDFCKKENRYSQFVKYILRNRII